MGAPIQSSFPALTEAGKLSSFGRALPLSTQAWIQPEKPPEQASPALPGAEHDYVSKAAVAALHGRLGDSILPQVTGDGA